MTQQPAYPDDWKILIDVDAGWTDITAYVISDIDAEWGNNDNGPLDMVAGTGTFDLVLNNSTGLFLPGSVTAIPGWKKGIRIKLVIIFEGEEYVRWKGIIQNIKPPSGRWEDFKMSVSCVDWMEYAAKHPIVNPGILSNKRGNEVITTTLGLMPIQPEATSLDIGVSIFPTTFDTVTSHTKAMSEFSKVVFSEIGRLYLRKDRIYGETLVFENSEARHGWRTLNVRPLANDEAGYLLKEDGGYLLKEDGGKLVLNQVSDFVLDNMMQKLGTEFGENVINRFTTYANPRRIDASPQILFRLNEPVLIASGQSVYMRGSYADPAGGLPINGQNMITPAATTDYLMNTAQNGSGTNITGDLTLDSVSYGTEGFTHLVRNNNANPGWLIQYNCRGYGIYQYNPIEHAETDSDSIAEYGVQPESIDQKYQTQLETGTQYARKIVELERNERVVVKEIECVANISGGMMMMFLTGDCGMLFHAISDKYGVDSYFFIEGVKFKIKPGGFIMFKWIVRQFWSLLSGLSMLALEFGVSGSTDGVDFGNLPYLVNQNKRSISLWVYPTSNPANSKVLLLFDGITLGITTTDMKAYWYQNQTGVTGIWTTPINSLVLNTWNHIIFTRDTSSSGTQDPIIYINGAAQTLTETSTPSGSPRPDTAWLVIGNAYNYGFPFYGREKDVRIYNRILSASEVAEIYNGGTPDASKVTSGLKFQAFAVRTKDYDLFEDQSITGNLRVLDNMFGAVGTPHGTPVGRTP